MLAEVERDVLYALAWARALRGEPLDGICERWDAASAVPGSLAESPERVAGQRAVGRSEIDAANERDGAGSRARVEVVEMTPSAVRDYSDLVRVPPAPDWQSAA